MIDGPYGWSYSGYSTKGVRKRAITAPFLNASLSKQQKTKNRKGKERKVETIDLKEFADLCLRDYGGLGIEHEAKSRCEATKALVLQRSIAFLKRQWSLAKPSSWVVSTEA